MVRPARAASFELTRLPTRMGGAANTSLLTRLVRELLFYALAIAMIAIVVLAILASPASKKMAGCCMLRRIARVLHCRLM
jgi:hypothetical protein